MTAPQTPPALTTTAQDPPTVHLGRRVAITSVKVILLSHVLLVVAISATMTVLFITWWTPVSRHLVTFTRERAATLPAASCAAAIAGLAGEHLADYARYAPCTVVKFHKSDVLTAVDAARWMTMVNDLDPPFRNVLQSARPTRGLLSTSTLIDWETGRALTNSTSFF